MKIFLFLAADLMKTTKSNLFYRKSGKGPHPIILLHGFGQEHSAFDTWLKALETNHTVYAFDHYYHGQSTREDSPLTIAQWKQQFEDFLLREDITKFSIVGFSLGGRFSLVTTTLFPERIRHLILIAPDGIFRSIWFRLATSSLGNPLFKYLMLHPDHFNTLLDTFKTLKITSSSMVRFAQKELQGKDNRKRVYRTWTYFKPIQVPISTVTRVINQHGIQAHLILGTLDTIIPLGKILSKTTKIRTLETHKLPYKHHHMIEASKTLVPSLLSGEFFD
ncbi:alpha/beta fold hydrolase [Marinoscillum luteum]|uniref:Alpha/beta fold hydrolase n=1 Tax=Marinoscillum luteum TaxID=861051 RepID=A0ABW7N2M8_9BACT